MKAGFCLDTLNKLIHTDPKNTTVENHSSIIDAFELLFYFSYKKNFEHFKTGIGRDIFLFVLMFPDGPTSVLSRTARDTSSLSSKERIDNQIYYLINEIPNKIETAKAAIEAATSESLLKAQTQGWSIVVASWKEIISDYISNNRTFTNFGGVSTLYSYGFIFSYGIGFGFPLLLGLPDVELACGTYDFKKLVEQYGLNYGVGSYFPNHNGALGNTLSTRVSEFDLLVHTKLNCIIGREVESIEAAEVLWALDELVSALQVRLHYETKY